MKSLEKSFTNLAVGSFDIEVLCALASYATSGSQVPSFVREDRYDRSTIQDIHRVSKLSDLTQKDKSLLVLLGVLF